MTEPQSQDNQSITNMRALVGDDIIRYTLSIDEETVLDGIIPNVHQKQVLSALAGYTSSDQVNNSQGLDIYMNLTDLSRTIPEAGMSIVNAMRLMTGGVVERPVLTGDAIVDSVALLASDVWPVYMLRPPGDGPRTFWMSSPIGIFNHPSLDQVIDAFLADEELMKLFPVVTPPAENSASGNTALGRSMQYQSLIVSNGQGGSLQLTSLISNLISNAAFRCLIGGEPLTFAAIQNHLKAAVEDLRQLATGKAVQVPALIGLAGLTLPEGTELELPGGRLRPARAADRELFLSGANSLSTVLETTFTAKIYLIKQHKFSEGENPFKDWSRYQPRIEETQRSFAHKVDLTRLALLLASSDNEPWLAREVARYIPDLLSHGGLSSWDPGFTSVVSHQLPQEKFEDVQRWSKMVRDNHVPSLDIGMRRLLSASTMRTDPIDAFVDAVVCWENMFGVETETNFRVTASLAKLLDPDNLASREALHKELKDLYGKRSRLVHGGNEPKAQELHKYRERSIEIAVECFRILYRDRPDLRDLPADKRGARLLLE